MNSNSSNRAICIHCLGWKIYDVNLQKKAVINGNIIKSLKTGKKVRIGSLDTGIKTEYIKDEIARCEDVEELEDRILPMIKSQQEHWSKKVNSIIAENNYTKTDFAKICGVSRVSVDKWCKGSIPKNREMFMRIGMAGGYDTEKMNELLTRFGRYPGLYSKSLEDLICIYILSHGYGKESVEKYDEILSEIKDKIIDGDKSENGDIETVKFDKELSNIDDRDELTKFILDNSKVFRFAYHKFYAYVKVNIEANYSGYGGTVYELAEAQGWSSSLRQCVSAIRQRKWYPTRNKVISLGLHLSMDHEQIDEMLSLAHMEPLCAKNLFESVIIFILEDASINSMLDRESDSFDPDDLVRYAGKVLERIDIPEVDEFMAELRMDDWRDDDE